MVIGNRSGDVHVALSKVASEQFEKSFAGTTADVEFGKAFDMA